MAPSKLYDSHAAAVADVPDGAIVVVGGGPGHSSPSGLISALADRGVKNLTWICGSIYQDAKSLDPLMAAGCVSRLITPGPIPNEGPIYDRWHAGELEVQAVPWGTLAERLRAAGAGIGGIFIPVGVGTRFAEERETRTVNGVECVLETPLRADFALVRAHRADTLGNLVYHGAQRGWNATATTAARITIAEVDAVGDPGSLDPELVITPGIFVNRLVLAESGK